MSTNNATTRDAAAPVKKEADRLWRDAKDAAQTAASDQKKAAAQGVGEFAHALREAAGHVGNGQDTTARIAQSVANGLDRLSTTLRNRDLNSMVRDVESFARAQPLVFFGAAVATGFVAMRFLKSSETAADESDEQPWQWPTGEPTIPSDADAETSSRPTTTP